MTTSPDDFRRFFESYGDRSARRIKRPSISPDDLPGTPRGNESLDVHDGDVAITTGQGQLRAGLEFTIERAENIHGYVRVYGLGCWHNRSDFTLKIAS